MAMRPTHDLLVKTGTYTAADGSQKGRWLKIGARSVSRWACRSGMAGSASFR